MSKQEQLAAQRRVRAKRKLRLLHAAAPAMLKELEFLADQWGEEFEDDLEINGADFVEWFAEVRPGILKVIRQARGKA